MELSKVIKRPLITEKTNVFAKQGKYTFIVDKQADKNLVRKAVEEFFKVEVKKVWLIKLKGKKKRVGRFRRKEVLKADGKKAVVKLVKDQKIDLFEGESSS